MMPARAPAAQREARRGSLSRAGGTLGLFWRTDEKKRLTFARERPGAGEPTRAGPHSLPRTTAWPPSPSTSARGRPAPLRGAGPAGPHWLARAGSFQLRLWWALGPSSARAAMCAADAYPLLRDHS